MSITQHVLQAVVNLQVVHWAVDEGSLCKKLRGAAVTWDEQGQGTKNKWALDWSQVNCPDCLAVGEPPESSK